MRSILPEMDNGRRLSKYETLQMAQQYIDCLSQLLTKNKISENDFIDTKAEIIY